MKNSLAYRNGHSAYLKGLTESSIPYDVERDYNNYQDWLVGFYEARNDVNLRRKKSLYDNKKLDARRRMHEAITRKAKERLNLLNDIVNFAYEYGENETKSLFQQAFKKAIGDDLVESLNDDD